MISLYILALVFLRIIFSFFSSLNALFFYRRSLRGRVVGLSSLSSDSLQWLAELLAVRFNAVAGASTYSSFWHSIAYVRSSWRVGEPDHAFFQGYSWIGFVFAIGLSELLGRDASGGPYPTDTITWPFLCVRSPCFYLFAKHYIIMYSHLSNKFFFFCKFTENICLIVC